MSVSMIVMDLDDTLLQDDLTISKKTKEILMKAQEKGIKVVLASGRPTTAMEAYAEELQLGSYGGYVISYNGAVITDCKDGKVIFEQALEKESIHALYRFSQEEKVFIHTYEENVILTAKMNRYTDIEGELTGIPVEQTDNFVEAVNRDLIKVILLEDPAYLNTVQVKLKEQFGDRMSIMISKPFFLECMPNGVDKGRSLQLLSERLDIKDEEILAIGDSYNDLSMLRFAGIGVAMQNAPDDIKQEVDYVTESNMNDGIVHAIEKFVTL